MNANGQAITTTPSQPIPRLFTFFTSANGLASQGSDQLDLKTGVDPNNSNIFMKLKYSKIMSILLVALPLIS